MGWYKEFYKWGPLGNVHIVWLAKRRGEGHGSSEYVLLLFLSVGFELSCGLLTRDHPLILPIHEPSEHIISR